MECTSQAFAAECTTRIARRILGVYQVGFTNGLGVFRFACGGRYLDTAAYTVCKRDTLMDYSAAHRSGALCLVADGEADVAEKENYYSGDRAD